ncbi:FAD-dependent oxidoreductase [Alkaliphilus peptidifermentans]|uniref:Protoporphyrinogen oxidase n=1 Tax=Alkaliphilus peptidifermentans DSM 18978 TaxID=1120976 RepID=A0A1G5IKK3_9FIRM|nr:FAD-dependent oxidoreductase [Alkaliphilus peptidifermentans]SCY76321.1 Protoporphyrinogen oxidase [Alkaliphilus peptidifermentans DSM 18978]
MNKIDCKVAVIGGGLSGLVIAAGLQKKGYRNVTVFERDNRLGGKLHTIWYKEKSYELGAIFGLPVQKQLQSLMKEFNIKIDGPSLSRVNYDINGNKIMQIPKETLGDFLKEVDRLPDVLEEYKSLERVNIHHLETSLMLPFSKWCDIHQFSVLKSIYMHHFSSYGLGDINQVPALYVLRILNYDTVMSFLEVPELFTWKAGVSSLIESLSQTVENIKLGQKVERIALSERDTLYLHTEFEALEFHRVVITAPLDEFADIFDDDEMKDFLRCIRYQDYTVYAFTGEKIPKGCGCVLENLSNNNKGHLIIWNSRWDSISEEGLLTTYAYNHPKLSKAESLMVLEKDLLKLGIQNLKLHRYKSWKQGPYVDTHVLQKGFYDKMEMMQGKNNIFLAGEIMSTVSMENCIRYSNYLINKYF